MANNAVTTQGQAWDQIALDRLGSEKQMASLLPRNTDEMDALLFAGEVELAIPKVVRPAAKSLPPWERM